MKIDYKVETIVLDERSHGVNTRKLGHTLCGITLSLEDIQSITRSGSKGYASASTLTCRECRQRAETGNS